MGDVEETKSEIALAIEQRERKFYEFEVEGFFGLGERSIPKLAIRALTKHEENLALVAAHDWAKKYSKGDEDARSDDDLAIGLTLSRKAVGLWTADPFRKIGQRMARKVYARIELPADAPEVRSVWVESAKVGALPIDDTPDPVWAMAISAS